MLSHSQNIELSIANKEDLTIYHFFLVLQGRLILPFSFALFLVHYLTSIGLKYLTWTIFWKFGLNTGLSKIEPASGSHARKKAGRHMWLSPSVEIAFDDATRIIKHSKGWYIILVMSTVLRKTVEDTGAEKKHCSQEDYFSFLFLFFFFL